eukprot:CAMPEP_0194069620 /NCGR_PEP_ID=MMETSP0009_2-20130614/87735_1 /TAXON_ID=210454 /ORGANISM="Grammatophora oceanica, Strain CCMP 410" /LENGTH=180 /DNA_ID=CAMNT_0038722825 /DNA_START=258 /DNA_END=800 /DNA_ORIENTATION=-
MTVRCEGTLTDNYERWDTHTFLRLSQDYNANSHSSKTSWSKRLQPPHGGAAWLLDVDASYYHILPLVLWERSPLYRSPSIIITPVHSLLTDNDKRWDTHYYLHEAAATTTGSLYLQVGLGEWKCVGLQSSPAVVLATVKKFASRLTTGSALFIFAHVLKVSEDEARVSFHGVAVGFGDVM